VIRRVGTTLLTGLSASSVAAADMLPLKRGIYVDVNVPCKGASNADTVSYWGEDNGINVSKAACTIKARTRHGRHYELRRACRDTHGGSWHDHLKVTIRGSESLIIRRGSGLDPRDVTYRYCGPKVQF
jgi:hypothetical protein